MRVEAIEYIFQPVSFWVNDCFYPTMPVFGRYNVIINCCLGWHCCLKRKTVCDRLKTFAEGSVWVCMQVDLEGFVGSCIFVQIESDSKVIAFSNRDVGFTLQSCEDTGDISTSCKFVVMAFVVFGLVLKVCAFLECDKW